MSIETWLSRRIFNLVHRNNLVYNTCWEDPRLDRVALELKPSDRVLVITSAGCNALDYALAGAGRVYAVDMNPRQNALLELKRAAIKRLDYGDFFQMFGQGYLPHGKKIYRETLRNDLDDWARKYWDKRFKFFTNPKKSFFFRGTSGAFARIIKFYIDRWVKVRPSVDAILAAPTLEAQQKIYHQDLEPKFWTKPLRMFLNRDTALSMLGVPKAQRKQIEKHYEGGVVKFIEDCIHAVFAELPLKDNYFWRVYLTGCYTHDCRPEYVSEEGYTKLRAGAIDNVTTHTDSVTRFLERHDGKISRFVLLDHMDWLSDHFFPYLEDEWEAILKRADQETRILWRSGGLKTDFIDRVQVGRDGGKLHPLTDHLTFHPELAAELHKKDRVHTYGSFYIADLKI
jgi:S-adenosylmethionine-diacylglycerol 3-amino-3-carboxypropyl transferase